MISHQHPNVDVDMVDGVHEVAEEEEHINVKQTRHPEESELKLKYALDHPINLNLKEYHPEDPRFKLYCHALYLPINLNLNHKCKEYHPRLKLYHNQHPSLQSSLLVFIMFLCQLDKVANLLMHKCYVGDLFHKMMKITCYLVGSQQL